ncbi:DUF1850 domain-containing protein [Chelatococcus sp. SYSU_G07232]|uniref:DUF1850 domain-containing protein n=1 Tax=Chelatococcus albus TaxID=3047466 RepID=A0ABT7AG64_9HYPH|nr:DUF1850 domain-containing protein [Chelatococcus sp. SYSU_G07232]MDJ1158344.1 DUF1850 domain-containing protein [Chelatococcus sp. SYSU_G07232]
MSLCLVAGALVVRLGVDAATLAWTHSVEKTAWEEDWAATAQGLVLREARVRGSGAGMEPPPDARFTGGAWRWTPHLPPLGEVILRRSGATADWRVCTRSGCRAMDELLPADADPVVMKPCWRGLTPAR